MKNNVDIEDRLALFADKYCLIGKNVKFLLLEEMEDILFKLKIQR